MEKNIGILSCSFEKLSIIEILPSNRYICYCKDSKSDEIYDISCNGIEFLISNDCSVILIIDSRLCEYITKFKSLYKNINFLTEIENLNDIPNSVKKIFVYNLTNKRRKFFSNYNEIIDYNDINISRKDEKPENTVKKIKRILKENNIKVKEKYKRRNLNGLYSLRLEINNQKGANGKGLSYILAKASAYAELLERLQSNMLNKSKQKISKTNKIDKKNALFDSLLKYTSDDYKIRFFELNNVYFETEEVLNIKTNEYVDAPINSINFFCHTNGLASGNSFSEAINQGIFEILERYCYKFLIDNNLKIKNIDVDKYPINKKNSDLLNKLKMRNYNFYIKDCSLGKYPVIGFLLLNNDETKYAFTMGSDYSFDIALSRCITEMFQGMTIKDLNKKMLDRVPLNDLNKRFKNDYLSYNWLKCFNNNEGYLSDGFFCKDETIIKDLKFKNFFIKNDEILEYLKESIDQDILVKDYSILGFDTYRVYIPYISSVDCYDIVDLPITKYFNKLSNIYTNITDSNSDEINLFIDIIYEICHSVKYDSLVKPSDVFHVDEISDYYKLDFTSLLILLMIKQKRIIELVNLLTFKIKNFNLNDKKINTYKILINKLLNKNKYSIKNKHIESQLDEIINNTHKYILSLNPNYINKIDLHNKKSSH